MTIDQLSQLFVSTRAETERICSFLETEDYVLQPAMYVSPPKWHLAHTSWFFEEFLLTRHVDGYVLFSPDYSYLFNSYYESLGEKVLRDQRGNLSRPTVEETYAYRQSITKQMLDFLKTELSADIEEVVLIGIHHEKQHQELLLTDIKFILGYNPLFPVYDQDFVENPTIKSEMKWISMPEGIYSIGHQKEDEFCYDNELAPHKVYLQPYSVSSNLVTNAEYMEFMEAGGYKEPLLWHAEGWEWVKQTGTNAPLYWHLKNEEWQQFTLSGVQKVQREAPLAHVSYFEAFAFAQWKGARLPTEFEWEAAQKKFDYGSRWEWTESSYRPYPGYKKPAGAIGEYNGKFMVNQMVLRGGSVATPENHFRPTYRNFFHPQLRWQFSGIRLAK